MKYRCEFTCSKYHGTENQGMCCKECTEKENCIDFCEDAEKKYCKYRTPKRIRKKTNWLAVFLATVLILLVAQCCFTVWGLCRISQVEMMQTDTLNQIMDFRLVMEVYSEENEDVEQVVDEEIKQAVKTSQKILSNSDFEYITRVCMAEAGSDYEGCLAVAQVIHDRAALWDLTPIEAVTQEGQFAQPRIGEPLYEESVQAVEDVFYRGVKAFEDANVTHFHSGEEPYWTVGKEYIGSRGGNYFYR